MTEQELAKFAPRAERIDELYVALTNAMHYYGIDQKLRRVRYFMAQSYCETQGFTAWSENLYYTTPERLCAVWPSRFHYNDEGHGPLDARDYVRNPEKLANEVYANRMGNGDPASGDGWRFIGRGAGHLTGRDNYTKYSHELYDDDRFVQNPDLVQQYSDGCLTFAAFWFNNKLNGLADYDEFTECTHRINGSSGNRLRAVVQQRLPILGRANHTFF